MDCRQLRYFVTIVDCGSLSKAAEKLHIAQPSLSQHVHNLEAELEVQLLNRTSRGVTATPAGERLMHHAKEVLSTFEHIKRDVKETAAGLTGSVVLGMPEKYSAVLTVPVIERIEKELPNIDIRIIENMSGNLLEWLLSGRVDIAILFQGQCSPELVVEQFISEDLFLVGGPDNALRDLDVVPFQRLADLPLNLPSKKSGLRMLLEETAALNNVRLSVKLEIDSVSAIKSLLRISRGYTLLSNIACKKERLRGDLWAAPIVAPTIAQKSVLAYRHCDGEAPQVMRIRDIIFDVGRALILDGAWPGAELLRQDGSVAT